MLSEFKFNPLGERSKPSAGAEVLLFLNDIWLGYDEILVATFDGRKFYHQNGREIHAKFIAGWLGLPIALSYGSSKSILP